jgi:hypothetical protein
MGRLFADGSVRRFFLNFPIPCFKRPASTSGA